MPKKRANGEGSLRKRKDGRWEGRYTAGCDPTTGKPIHTRASSLKPNPKPRKSSSRPSRRLKSWT